MSQQPPPWGPQQFPQQGQGGETPSGVPAPRGNQPSRQPSGPQSAAQQYPQQQYSGQQYPQQQYQPQPGAQPSAPRRPAQGPDAATPVGSPATWLKRFPRLLTLAGAVLSIFMMMAVWASLTYSVGLSSSSSFTSNVHGLVWLTSTKGVQAVVSAGAWNFRVVATLLVLIVLVVLASIGLALDRLLAPWWDLTTLVCTGVLVVLMIWGIVQASQLGGSMNSTTSVDASLGAGVWLFLVTVLVTAGGAVWQFVLNRQAAAPKALSQQPAQQWAGGQGWQQGAPQPGYQQPGYPQGGVAQPPQPPQQGQQWPQQPGGQQGWPNNPNNPNNQWGGQ